MAAPTSSRYAKAAELYGTGGLTWASDTIKMRLLPSTYTPDYDTHAFLSDAGAAATNAVDQALATKTHTKVGTGATAKYALSSAKASFTGSITARYGVIYKDTGNAATSPLICLILLDSAPADVTSTVGIDVTPDATNGWLLVG